MKNGNFSKLLDDNRFLLLLSFLLAVFLWVYVVVYVNNQHSTVIRNVPINIAYRQSLYQSMGLDVVEMDVDTVDVYVSGPRSSTGDLSKEDIIIYPNITSIDGSGTYTFTLTRDKTSSVKNFNIDSLSQDYVTVRFDTLTTREYTLGVDISRIVVSGDNIAGVPTVSPATVSVTGPKNKMETIARAVAVIPTEETLYQTGVRSAVVVLYDREGKEVSRDLLKLSNERVDVTIPVMREMTLPVKVDYVNVPAGFDTNILHQSLSSGEIHVAVPSAVAPTLTDFVVGYIDLATLKTDEPYVFDITLPTGYTMMEDKDSVTVTISSRNLTEKKVDVTEIKVINDREGRIQVLTDEIKDVVLVGETDRMETITTGGVIAQIDASKISVATGQQSVEVSFLIPSTDRVYARGIYTVNVKA